ncbi:hypothetical protein EVAR_82242_1 [Eumeta japonica]|uniref:Uncharacterized protein n=1 Tax=Eumeta variegata TaxID=151549 RepID=A0A4C1VYC4_EUMVA|nr:hypothetical protein EVAR_82242_1 [Eumeta japonica]
MRVTVIRRSSRGDTGRNSATRVERGAGDARRSGVTHAGSGARGRAAPALGDEAVAARAGHSTRPVPGSLPGAETRSAAPAFVVTASARDSSTSRDLFTKTSNECINSRGTRFLMRRSSKP